MKSCVLPMNDRIETNREIAKNLAFDEKAELCISLFQISGKLFRIINTAKIDLDAFQECEPGNNIACAENSAFLAILQERECLLNEIQIVLANYYDG